MKDKDKDKEGPARTPFQETVFSLMEEIKRKLAPREQRYLADEFSFFDQVTAISGILKVSVLLPFVLVPVSARRLGCSPCSVCLRAHRARSLFLSPPGAAASPRS